MKKTIAILIFILLTISSVLGAEGLNKGGQSPNIVGRTLKGSFFSLKKVKNRAKVINFFWVGCAPCVKEMPELAGMEKRYPQVRFISVHTGNEGKKTISRFVKQLKGSPSTIVIASLKVKEAFAFTGLPHTIVLDKDNKVLLTLEGYTRATIKKLENILINM